MTAEPAIEHDHLPDHRQPYRSGAGDHRHRSAEVETERKGAGGESDDQRLPHDELRHQRQPHPVMGARDAVLGVGHDERRQRQAAEIKRHDAARLEMRGQQPDHAGQQRRHDCRNDAGHPARAGQEAAQQCVVAAGPVFRNDLLGGSGDAEIHHRAEQQHPGPDIDIDAVVARAHPARQQDLRQIRHGGGHHADQEDGAGEAPRHRGFARSGEQAEQPRLEAGGRC